VARSGERNVSKRVISAKKCRPINKSLNSGRMSQVQPVSPYVPAHQITADVRLQRAFEFVTDGLRRIELRIAECLHSDAPALSEISNYLLQLGGKRIRPVICLLSHSLFSNDEPPSELVDAAAGIEMIHMATLLHDDIIDRSPIRRRKPSAYAKYGLDQSLLTGDFLLVRAFGLCAHLDLFVVEATEAACVELTEGEVLEGIIDPHAPPKISEYLRVIEKKTASLFALSACVGAHLAGASPEDVKRLRQFGVDSGVAFQMIDDILDITADEDLLGKQSGTDLRQKTPSLVNLLWIEEDPQSAIKFFTSEAISVEQAKQQAFELRSSPVVPAARQIASDRAQVALDHLSRIQAVEPAAKNHLEAILQFTLERCL
jgi:geranylgeranyl pyrophosphate synthase